MANILDNALALGSVPYNFAKGIIGNPSDPGAVTQVSLTEAQKEHLNEIAQAKGTLTGNIDYSDYGSPTKIFSGISGMTPLDASLATTMGGTGYTTNPDGSINYTGGEYNFGHGSNNPITNFINTGGIIGAADRFGKNIYDFIHGPQMRFRQQQFMNKKKQDMQRRIREAEKKRIEQAQTTSGGETPTGGGWKPTYNPASSHAEAQATGGDYHSDTRSTVDGQTTDWGPMSHMIARGGLAQRAPRGSYFNGGLASLYRHGGF